MTLKYLYLKNQYRNMILYSFKSKVMYDGFALSFKSKNTYHDLFTQKWKSYYFTLSVCIFCDLQWQAVNCYGLIKKLDQHILFKHSWFAKIRIYSRRRQSHRHRDFQRDKDLLYFPYQYCIKIETTRHHGPFNNVRVKAKH